MSSCALHCTTLGGDRCSPVLLAPAGYRTAEAFPNKAKQQYPDVKWGCGQDANMLYAACLDGSVDVYKLD